MQTSFLEDPLTTIIQGNRITSLQYFVNEMKRLSNHNPEKGCTFNNLSVVSEDLFGLNSDITMHCNNCLGNFKISLTNPNCKTYDLNASLLSDEVVTKLGHSGVKNMLDKMELPPISLQQYNDMTSANTGEVHEVFIKSEIDTEEYDFEIQ